MIEKLLSTLSRAQVERLRRLIQINFLGELSRADLARQFHVTGTSITRDMRTTGKSLAARLNSTP